MIYPRPLKPGDAIAIVSPASKINPELIDAASRTIEHYGYRPILSDCCKTCCGSFSGSINQRLCDLQHAFENHDVRAVLCSRGGYGVVQLINDMNMNIWHDDPKWLIGFSDISALHAVAHYNDVASIHASMCKHLASRPDDECTKAIFSILAGEKPQYEVEGNYRNREGEASGEIVGGNLAVLSGLNSTPYNLLQPGKILFIEDIAEAIYKVERMLYTLKLNGTLAQTKALIVGQFTDWKSSDDFQHMYDMVENMVKDYDFPVAYDFPIGHVERNLPIIEGAQVELKITKEKVNLNFK